MNINAKLSLILTYRKNSSAYGSHHNFIWIDVLQMETYFNDTDNLVFS